MNKQTLDRLSNLASSVGLVKKVTMNIKQQMVDDESLVADLDKGLIKNQNLLKQTMGRIDQMLTSASGNVLCYTIMFFFMILALLKPPKSHRGYSSQTTSQQGIDYYQSLHLTNLINEKSIKSLRKVQVERIHKILETQLDKDLYEIIKKKIVTRLPKIMSQKNVDESLQSNQIKNEKKRRRTVRRELKKQYNVDDLKTSSYPKYYSSSYFDPEILRQQKEQEELNANKVQHLIQSVRARNQSQQLLTDQHISMQKQVQYKDNYFTQQNESARPSALIIQKNLSMRQLPKFIEGIQQQASTQTQQQYQQLSLRELLEKRKHNKSKQVDQVDQVKQFEIHIEEQKKIESNEKEVLSPQRVLKNHAFKMQKQNDQQSSLQKQINPQQSLDRSKRISNTQELQITEQFSGNFQPWQKDQAFSDDQPHSVDMRKSGSYQSLFNNQQQSNYQTQQSQRQDQAWNTIKTARVKEFQFQGLSRDIAAYEKIDIEKLLKQAKKMDIKKQQFKI
eukprot:403364616